jgi:hypothetical protein
MPSLSAVAAPLCSQMILWRCVPPPDSFSGSAKDDAYPPQADPRSPFSGYESVRQSNLNVCPDKKMRQP